VTGNYVLQKKWMSHKILFENLLQQWSRYTTVGYLWPGCVVGMCTHIYPKSSFFIIHVIFLSLKKLIFKYLIYLQH
jgi:hypothetical protein